MFDSEIENLRHLFDAKSIAIVGASSDMNKIGGRPIKNLMDFNYQGKIYPINPKYDSIGGHTCYPNIKQVPGEIDLAIIVVPGSKVIDAANECGERGVRAIVVFSSGFAEVSEAGRKAEEELLQICRQYGMRMLGPNVVGFFNLQSNLMSCFGIGSHLGKPKKGNISMISHSGAFSAQFYLEAVENNLGINHFIGLGNQTDIDVSDCVAYLADDPDTEMILCYMEGAKNLEKFAAALEYARTKNTKLIVLKSGRSEDGRELALSHSNTDAGTDAVYDEIFNKPNVYRVYDVQELFDIFKACAYGIPQEGNVAVFTISGGVGILLADQFSDSGVKLPEVDSAIQAELKQLIPFANVKNPVDMTAQLMNDPGMVLEFMDKVLGSGNYDVAIIYLAVAGYNKTNFELYKSMLKKIHQQYPGVAQILVAAIPPKNMDLLDNFDIVWFDNPYRAGKAAKALCHFAVNKHHVNS